MKNIKLNVIIRSLLLIISFVLLIILLGIIFIYYMIIMSDIPPQPTGIELHTLERMVCYWLIILIINYCLVVFTTNKK
ncbi:MAG: hypothetical protein N4A50_11335 [Vallitalea sp.]|jgi:hypothetical protein|nr:hypothetical protein [Vallitalea sp.]